MANVKVELNSAGVRNLLRSNEMKDISKEYADRAADSLGNGYETDSYVGTNRANAMIAAESFEAKRENVKHNTILKAVMSLR